MYTSEIMTFLLIMYSVVLIATYFIIKKFKINKVIGQGLIYANIIVFICLALWYQFKIL